MNRQPRLPDFPVMLNNLMGEGITSKQLADKLGYNFRTIERIAREQAAPPPDWDACYLLIDAYLRKFGVPVPFLGEHNEGVN